MLDWYPLSFQSDGTLLFLDQLDGPQGIFSALNAQTESPVTDLWILSYGWNTSVAEGDAFYKNWTALLRAEIRAEMQHQRLPQNYQPLFIGVYWPSIILADTTSRPVVPPAPASALPAAPDKRTNFIQAYRPIFAPELQPDDAVFAQDFGSIYDFLATHSAQMPDPQELEVFVSTLKKYQPQDPHADQPVSNNMVDAGASAIGQGITDAFTSGSLRVATALDGLLEFLRVFSFWTMKARAGTVGVNGLAPVLTRLTGNLTSNISLHIHLMGHSFGAKLLTSAVYAAAESAAGNQPVVDSLILFQGAFSQFSFSQTIPNFPQSAGFYVPVLKNGMTANPLAVIYSTKDLANKNLYPLGMAPILSPDVIFRDLPNPNSYHTSGELRGSIGANGAQGIDDVMFAVTLPWTGIDQNLLSGIRCINLNRTPFLSLTPQNDPVSLLIGAHSDYNEPEIFHGIVEVSLLNRG